MQGISGYSGMPALLSQEARISPAQEQALTGFLSLYDTDNLSKANAQEILAKIREIGIPPGAGLASILSDFGVDARSLNEKAGVGGTAEKEEQSAPANEENKGRAGVDDTLVSLISDAVKAYEESDEADTLWSVMEPALRNAGYDTSRPLIDFYS